MAKFVQTKWPEYFGNYCYYCGAIAEEGNGFILEHFIPKSKGGTDTANIVLACRSCNSIKGGKLFKDARIRLLARRIGWPYFNSEQLEWLRKNGFDMSQLDNGKLFFEEQPPCPLHSIELSSKASVSPRKKQVNGSVSPSVPVRITRLRDQSGQWQKRSV